MPVVRTRSSICGRRETGHCRLELRSRPCSLALVVLALAFLAGCQGISSANNKQDGTGDPSQGTLTPNPASFSFGNVQVGSHSSQWENLKNTGGSNLTISQASVSGTGFSVSGFTPPITLTPGQIYTFSVIFTPPGAGTGNGSLSLTSDASNATLTVSLTGTGTTVATGQLAVSPTSLNFGNVAVGSNGPLNATLSASGASVTVTSVNVNSNVFTVSGLTFPVTIPAGQKAQFTVTFTPQATGVASATATFASDASNSPTVQSLTGTGVNPSPHYVDLSWNASTSQDITGYNIYRGTIPGGPYSKINSSLDSSTIYTDDSVVSGQTYYYVTTAMNSSDQESGYSNQAKAVIPSP